MVVVVVVWLLVFLFVEKTAVLMCMVLELESSSSHIFLPGALSLTITANCCLFAVPVLVLWVRLEKRKITKNLDVRIFF